MCLTWFEHWLLTNNTFSFYFTLTKTCIINVPVPPKKLNGVFAMIFN